MADAAIDDQMFNAATPVVIVLSDARGKTATGAPCFISGTRKRTIKAIIRNAAPPQDYTFLTFEDNYLAGQTSHLEQGQMHL